MFRSIRKDPRRVTFKDVTEDMIPAGMEKIQPVRASSLLSFSWRDSLNQFVQSANLWEGHKPGGVLLGILGGGVPPGSSNPDPISDLNMPFSTPVFRPDL